MDKSCFTCKTRESLEISSLCLEECFSKNDYPLWKERDKKISFPICNGLTPNISSCTAKVYEEIGELMQLLGKGQRQSGELIEQLNNHNDWVMRTVEEALDGTQALVTLVCTLLDEPGDIEIAMERHIEKLKQKGYLK